MVVLHEVAVATRHGLATEMYGHATHHLNAQGLPSGADSIS